MLTGCKHVIVTSDVSPLMFSLDLFRAVLPPRPCARSYVSHATFAFETSCSTLEIDILSTGFAVTHPLPRTAKSFLVKYDPDHLMKMISPLEVLLHVRQG